MERPMPTPRRDFLRHTGISAAALVTLPSFDVAGVSLAGERSATPSWLNATRTADEPWDTSWTKKLGGTHRTVFDIPEIEFGYGVLRAGIWGKQVSDVFKPQPSQVNTVLVLRHNAIPLVMSHEFWNTYDVARKQKVKDEAGKTVQGNPVLSSSNDASLPPMMAALRLDKQIAGGAIALGCNLAFGDIVDMVAKQDKLSPEAAREKALRYMIPGVTLQPSGGFAVVLAQQNGCVFVRGS
jgi:hypothetical protein